MQNISELRKSVDRVRIEIERQFQDTDPYSTTKEKLLFIRSNIELFELCIGVIESFAKQSNLISSDIESFELIGGNKAWNQLRSIAERMQRRIIILQPPSPEEFNSTLMWMSAQGEIEELQLLRKVQQEPHYDSKDIDDLLRIAIQRIEARIGQQEISIDSKRYKVLRVPEQIRQRFPDVNILNSYASFAVISASEDTITDIKKIFPVEPLESPKDSNNINGTSNMTNTRDRVIRFNAPVLESWKQRIEETGSKILQPLGRLEFVVSVPSEDIADQISNFEEVAQVTPYVPNIRVQPQSLQNLGQPATKEAIAAARLNAARNANNSPPRNLTLPGILTAVFFTQEDRDLAAQKLEAQSIRIADRPGKNKLIVDLSRDTNAGESLTTITEQVGLQSLEEKTIPKLFNDEACRVIARGVIPSNPTPTLGLTGKGELIAIADTGLDTGETDTLHLDFRDRVNLIQSYPIKPSLTSYVLNPSGDDGASDSYSGHGTHVAGSALGSGEQARELGLSSIPIGMAPEAKLVFQAIEQTPKWNREGKLLWLTQYRQNPPKSGLFGIPDDLGQLFQEAYNIGVRIHSNSWGGGEAGAYDSQCEDLDRFVWEHKDFLVVVAAGNDGKHSSSGTPGIDQGSITAPGTAKNCLTVGASENKRDGQFSDSYGNWWPDDFPHLPFKTDNMVNSIDDIAAFSSRGPCQNGYRKPDVIAPGTFILSTRSSQIASNNFAWGAYTPAKDHYMYMGGTSMATPLVAGCAALVRQYLREKHQPSIPDPSAALVKAILVHSAQYINYRHAHPSSAPWADNEQGWGRVDLQKVLNPTTPTQSIFIDEANGLITGKKHEHKIKITDALVPLKVTLVYTDYPGEDLINNLNLIVHSPSGKHYLGNDFEEAGNSDNINNVEGVVIKSPETGEWRIEIVADVQMGQQDYAVVISGGGALQIN
jgi:serine protease AprX